MHNGRCVIYNSKTTALAVFEMNKFQELKRAFDGRQINDIELQTFLISENFLLDNNIDELDQLKIDLFKSRFNASSLNFTLHPTSKCNFDCVYCFESQKLRSSNFNMSKEVQDLIVVCLQEKANSIKSFSVLWFGGEPLLMMDIIKRLSNKFIKICLENNVTYKASITTNGYLLNKNNVDILRKCHVDNIQITIDGLQATHDKRKPLKNSNKGTYNVIMQNLVYASKHFKKIMIRINVDKNNKNETAQLLSEIHKLNDNCNIFIELARVTANSNANSKYHSNCFSCNSFVACELDFINQLKKFKFKYDSYPSRMGNICGADQINTETERAPRSLLAPW